MILAMYAHALTQLKNLRNLNLNHPRASDAQAVDAINSEAPGGPGAFLYFMPETTPRERP